MEIPSLQIAIRHNSELPTGALWYRRFRNESDKSIEFIFNRENGRPTNRPPSVKHNSSGTQADIVAIGESAVAHVFSIIDLIENNIEVITKRKFPISVIRASSSFDITKEMNTFEIRGMVISKDAKTYSQWQAYSLDKKYDHIENQLRLAIFEQLMLATKSPNRADEIGALTDALEIQIDHVSKGTALLRAAHSDRVFFGHTIDRIAFRMNAHVVGYWSAGYSTAMGCGAIRAATMTKKYRRPK